MTVVVYFGGKKWWVGQVDEIATVGLRLFRNDRVGRGRDARMDVLWLKRLPQSLRLLRNDNGGVNPFYPSNPRPSGYRCSSVFIGG